MKSYSFAKVSARGTLTESDYNNKFIITDDLRLVINVSDKVYLQRAPFFLRKGIVVHNKPLTEADGDMGYRNLLMLVKHLLLEDSFGGRSLVCCDFGVNRSRTVIEAFHFAKMGFHFEDEYKGCMNHLIYNCEEGHLPPLPDVEHELMLLREDYKLGDFVYIMKMKERGIF